MRYFKNIFTNFFHRKYITGSLEHPKRRKITQAYHNHSQYSRIFAFFLFFFLGACVFFPVSVCAVCILLFCLTCHVLMLLHTFHNHYSEYCKNAWVQWPNQSSRGAGRQEWSKKGGSRTNCQGHGWRMDSHEDHKGHCADTRRLS